MRVVELGSSLVSNCNLREGDAYGAALCWEYLGAQISFAELAEVRGGCVRAGSARSNFVGACGSFVEVGGGCVQARSARGDFVGARGSFVGTCGSFIGGLSRSEEADCLANPWQGWSYAP